MLDRHVPAASLAEILLLSAISLVAGTIDAIGGGGGLLTVPALLGIGIAFLRCAPETADQRCQPAKAEGHGDLDGGTQLPRQDRRAARRGNRDLYRRATRDLENVMFVATTPDEIPWPDGFFTRVIDTANQYPGGFTPEILRVLAKNAVP